MIRAAAFAMLIAATAVMGSGAAAEDNLVILEGHGPDMRRAIEKARETLPEALEAASLDGPRMSEGLSLKVAIPVSGGNENIWVNSVVRNGDGFLALLANEPRDIPGKRLGSAVEFGQDRIIDWALPTDRGKFFGHYTTRVIIQKIAPEEARRIRGMLNLRPAPRTW